MLQSKIQVTIGLMQDVIDNRAKKNEHEAIAKRNTVFFSSLNTLLQTVDSYLSARQHFSFTLEKETLRRIKELMEYSAQAFRSKTAADPNNFAGSVKELTEKMSDVWKQYFHGKYDNLLSGLEMLMAVHSEPKQIKTLIASLKKCEKWPLNKEAAGEFKLNEKKAVSLLKSMDFDTGIKMFLEKTASNTATVADMTPEVYRWLIKEHVAEKISLVIRNDT